MKAKNFACKVLEHLKDGSLKGLEKYAPVSQEILKECLEGSMKFILPDDGKFFDCSEKTLRELWEMGPKHLPYPSVALEFSTQYPDPVEIEDASVVLLATQGGKEQMIVMLICIRDGKRPWTLYPASFCLGERNGDLVYDVNPETGLPRENFPEEFEEAFWGFATVLLSFLIALNCRNVRHARAEPSFIDRDRARRKKLPIFNYHVLVLTGVQYDSPNRGGTHASPRCHLRRGHIRHLHEFHGGGTIWVNATVVKSGDGLIHKDYAVLPRKSNE